MCGCVCREWNQFQRQLGILVYGVFICEGTVRLLDLVSFLDGFCKASLTYLKRWWLEIRTSHAGIYIREVCVVKRYGDRYKLLFLESKRIPGYEEELDEWEKFERKHGRKIKGRPSWKTILPGAKSRIYEIALCNTWSHFITGTLDATEV